MAAINFQEWVSIAGTPTLDLDTSNIRFHNTSDTGSATVNPMIRPVTSGNTGKNWSLNKYIDVQVEDDNSTWGAISNFSLAAVNVLAGGELRNSSLAATAIYLYSGFSEITGDPQAGDFLEHTSTEGNATAHPAVLQGDNIPWTAWSNGTAQPYGNVSTITSTNPGSPVYRLFSAESSLTNNEFFCLAIQLDDAFQTGGQIEGFTITLTYSEV
jgi:hypothetical protein